MKITVNIAKWLYENIFTGQPVIMLLVLLSITSVIKNKYQEEFEKYTKKNNKVKEDVTLIQAKYKDEHPEVVNYYLDEYYKTVDYNPVKPLIKLILSAVLYLSTILLIFSPEQFINNFSNQTFDFLLFKDVLSKPLPATPFWNMDAFKTPYVLYPIGSVLITVIAAMLETKIKDKMDIDKYVVKSMILTALITLIVTLIIHIAIKPSKMLYIYTVYVVLLKYAIMIWKKRKHTNAPEL